MAAAKEVDIVFVVQHLGVGGVSNSSIDLISSFLDEGHRVHVICLEPIVSPSMKRLAETYDSVSLKNFKSQVE